MGKRLVICCDGTWNTKRQTSPTNVVRFCDMIVPHGADGTEQRAFYHSGVGTGRWDRLRGGAFGFGLSRIVKDAYRIVVNNYDPGDELFFLGFSRGAFTARSTAGLIRNAGILRRDQAAHIDDAYALYRTKEGPDAPAAVEFRRQYSLSDRTPIRFIGVWDTVGSLGIPNLGIPLLGPVARWVNRRWAFHDVKLSSRVASAFQALSIDEARRPFEPTLWQQQPHSDGQQLAQVWFAGDHSDIGGGYADRRLAEIALWWLTARARDCGLAFRDDPGEPLDESLATGPVHDSRTGLFRLIRPVVRRLGAVDPGHESAASSAIGRQRGGGYDPPGLAAYLAGTYHEAML
ncbi:MAG: hypothetical protein BGO26_19150 [Actinobacteria bacterium 69-20]|jgi:uncharacterized protein (DUF2235 family)|nr:DUF2235 domain-containing protein [Actinomycetota bacterium]OJV24672.1 MAG: hypothetical protein BGO26_19150 [Actinobacteria bacterium 69-20]